MSNPAMAARGPTPNLFHEPPSPRETREYRTLRGATDAAAEAAEGDGLLLLGDVVEEGNSALELPAVDGLGGFPRVLERDTEVRAAGAGRLGGRDLLGCVSNLQVVPESAITVPFAEISRPAEKKSSDAGQEFRCGKRARIIADVL